MASDDSISVALVGDVFISRDNFGHDRESDERFLEVVELLRSADIAFGNFEIPLSERGYPADKFITIRTSPDRARDVKKMGLDAIPISLGGGQDPDRVGWGAGWLVPVAVFGSFDAVAAHLAFDDPGGGA